MTAVPEDIKRLLDEKSALFEPILWQDNLPYDDLNFSRKNIDHLVMGDLAKSAVKKEIDFIRAILKPVEKTSAVLLQNLRNIPYCLELMDNGFYTTGIDVSPFIVSYLNKNFHSKMQGRGRFIKRDIKKEELGMTAETILVLNNIIRDFPVWYMDNIIRTFSKSLSKNGILLVELIQNILCDAVFYYYESEDESPWYNNRCYVKYEIINFFRDNAFLEKYTVYNLDRDFVGFFSHSNTIYTYHILKDLFSKHGLAPFKVEIGWAGRPKNHQLIIFAGPGSNKGI